MLTQHRLHITGLVIFEVFLLQIPSAFGQTPAPAKDLSGKTDASIRAVLNLITKHQEGRRLLADGDYTPVTTIDALQSARAPKGIAWGYPWGVVLYGMTRASDFLDDKSGLDFVIRHNQIIARQYAFLSAASQKITATAAGADAWKQFLRDRDKVIIAGLMNLGNLDSCGSMGNQTLEAMLRHPDRAAPEQKAVVERIADWIVNKQARLPDGTFWRPERTDLAKKWPRGTIWIDDLYMACPFLVRWAQYTRDPRHLDDAARQIINMASRVQDTDGIWFHAYSEPLKQSNRIKWGRANGWAMVATVEVLSALPDNHPLRPKLLDILRRHIEGVKKVQAPTGLWRQVLNDETLWEETSCTAMFAYSIARAANRGWIPKENIDIARKAFIGICTQVTPEGAVGNTCQGTDIGMDVDYYRNRARHGDNPHGPGVVLLAGAEILASLSK